MAILNYYWLFSFACGHAWDTTGEDDRRRRSAPRHRPCHGDDTGSIAPFRIAFEQMPESRSLTQEYMTALFFLRRDDENIAVQRKHLEVDPINAESHFDLGLVYLIQGANREAADHLTDATRLAPINGKAQAAPTKALEATGESAAATACARAQALGYDSP